MSNINIGGNINSPNVNIGGNQVFEGKKEYPTRSIERDIHERAEFFKALCDIKLNLAAYFLVPEQEPDCPFGLDQEMDINELLNNIEQIVDKCLEGYI